MHMISFPTSAHIVLVLTCFVPTLAASPNFRIWSPGIHSGNEKNGNLDPFLNNYHSSLACFLNNMYYVLQVQCMCQTPALTPLQNLNQASLSHSRNFRTSAFVGDLLKTPSQTLFGNQSSRAVSQSDTSFIIKRFANMYGDRSRSQLQQFCCSLSKDLQEYYISCRIFV